MGRAIIRYFGEELINLTTDTLEDASQLLKGVIAHDKNGDIIVGELEPGADIPTYDFKDIIVNGNIPSDWDFSQPPTIRQTFLAESELIFGYGGLGNVVGATISDSLMEQKDNPLNFAYVNMDGQTMIMFVVQGKTFTTSLVFMVGMTVDLDGENYPYAVDFPHEWLPVYENKNIDITENGKITLEPSELYDAISRVDLNVNVPIPEPSYDTPSIEVSAGGLITASANGKSNTKQLSAQAGTTITPTESEQTAVASGKYTTGAVKVGAISSTYVGSGVTKRTSSDLTASGATVTVPAGYYSSQQTKSVASGTAGTPSATKGNVSNNQISITPTVTNTTGYITGGTKNGTAVTVKASDLVSGSETKTANGTYDVTNLAQLVVNVAGGGGGLPSGIAAFDYGNITVSSAFTTTRQTFAHKLGVVPDLMIVFATANIATTYSMLAAIRGNVWGWRSSAYNNHMAYHGNSTSTVSWTNSNSTTYGISNMTASSFQLASSSSSYYWRAGTYKYIAIKFS